ncbi:phosphoadenosine phosphosulfate reductase [Celeribacter arenosi]|uniref:Phosphoadenosine phosphosulfate reductase n=1 Tax=Celeribacter arenosi TaxID=792649 RepID=A0ABP7KAW8_9RHOB
MSEDLSAFRSALDACGDVSGASRNDWVSMVDDLATEYGYFEPLGADHAVAFIDAGPKLLVCFETFESIQARGQNGLPSGFSAAADNGWSTLTMIAHGESGDAPWFRRPHVYGYFDRLVNDAFFEDFDQVVIYGAGSGGYAAAAYSVAAPGATVIAVSPQATLDGRMAAWDHRYAAARRADFTGRYGFAPHMIDGAGAAFVMYDPRIDLDAMHAALFARAHVALLPLRHFGAHPDKILDDTGALDRIIGAAMSGRLNPRVIHREARTRRLSEAYLTSVLNAIDADQNPLRCWLLCRHARRAFPKNLAFEAAGKQAAATLNARSITLPKALTPALEGA